MCHQIYPKEYLGMYYCYCSVCSQCADNIEDICPICDEECSSANRLFNVHLPLDNIKWLSRTEYVDLINKLVGLMWKPPPINHAKHIITGLLTIYKNDILKWNKCITRFVMKSKLMMYNLILNRGYEHQYDNILNRMRAFYQRQNTKRFTLYKVNGNIITVFLPHVTHIDAKDTDLIIDNHCIDKEGVVTEVPDQPRYHLEITSNSLTLTYNNKIIKQTREPCGRAVFFPGIDNSHLLYLFDDSVIVDYFKKHVENINIFHSPFKEDFNGVNKSIKIGSLLCAKDTQLVMIDTFLGGIRRYEYPGEPIKDITDVCILKDLILLLIGNSKLLIMKV